MLKEISELIHGFIRRNRYRKAIAYCEFCGKPFMKKQTVYLTLEDKIVCWECMMFHRHLFTSFLARTVIDGIKDGRL
jgi:formylmethanofuran dehydrogenase subunit E